MIKLTITTLALLGLVGSAQMQGINVAPPTGGFGGMGGPGFGMMGGPNGAGLPLGLGNGLPLGLGNNLPLGLGGNQGPLNSLFGGAGGQQNPQQGLGGLTDTLRQLPQRGFEMLSNLMQGVRSLLPGNMGRNANNSMPRNPMDLMNNNGNGNQSPLNMQNPFANQFNANQMMDGGNPLNELSSNLQGLTRPVTDALSQGRLPDVNSLGQQLSQAAGNLRQGLTRTLSNVVPAANGAPTNIAAANVPAVPVSPTN